MRMFRVLMATSSLVLSATAQAQDVPAEPNKANEQTADTGGGLGEIVVTARKRSEDIQTVPIAVTAISPQAIEDRQIVSVGDLQKVTPGVSVQQSQYSNFGALVGLRGRLTGDAQLVLAPAIGVYIDDVYQPALTGVFAPDLEDIAQIEVLKGPQGTLYGRNTVQGAIKISHNRPDYDGIGGSYRIGIGNLSRQEVTGVLNVPIVDDKVAVRISGLYRKDNGWGRDQVNGNRLSDINLKSVRAAVRIDASERLNILLNGSLARATSGGLTPVLASVSPGFSASSLQAGLEIVNADPTRYPTELAALTAGNRLPVAAVGNAELRRYLAIAKADPYNPFLKFQQSQKFIRRDASANIGYDLTDDITIRSITAFSHVLSESFAQTSATPFNIINGQAQGQTIDQFTQELQISGQSFSDRLNWTAGYFYFDSRGDDVQNPFFTLPLVSTAVRPQRRFTDVKDRSHAVYGQATFSISDSVRVTGGLRYTTEKQDVVAESIGSLANGGTFCLATGVPVTATTPCRNEFSNKFNNLSYLASADWKISSDVFAYASVSRGFKAGGQNGKGLPASATTPLVGFNGFKPELATSYEVGLKTDLLNNRLRINGAVYHIDYIDLQERILTAVNNQTVVLILNSGSAKTDGFELDITAQVSDNLVVQGSTSYTDSKYKEFLINGTNFNGLKFQGIPTWQHSISATYTSPTPIGEFSMTGSAYRQSTVNFSPTNFGPFTGDTQIQRAYTLVDLSASIEFNPALKVSLWVKNLTKRFYAVGAVDLTSVGYTIRYPGAPRTFGLQLSGRF